MWMKVCATEKTIFTFLYLADAWIKKWLRKNTDKEAKKYQQSQYAI